MQPFTVSFTVSLVSILVVHGTAQMVGPSGPPGQQGMKGQKGDRGESGTRGPRGLRGIPGRPGLNGLMGEKGLSGTPGSYGPRGTVGPRGSLGPKGPIGDMGQPGPPGKPGAPSDHYHHYVKQNDVKKAEQYQCACSDVSSAVSSLQLSVQQTSATQTSLMLQLTSLQHTLNYHLTMMSRHIARLTSAEKCSTGNKTTSYPPMHQQMYPGLHSHQGMSNKFWPLMNGWYPWKWKPSSPVKTHPHKYTTEPTTVSHTGYEEPNNDNNKTSNKYSDQQTKPYNEYQAHGVETTTVAYKNENDTQEDKEKTKPRLNTQIYEDMLSEYKHTTAKPSAYPTTVPTKPTKRQGCYVGLIAWYAGRCTGWKAPRDPIGSHLLPMEEEYVNFGNAYQLELSSFVAPANGFYIMSYSIAANLRESANVTLLRISAAGEMETLSDLNLASTRGRAHVAVDTVSKSLFLSLKTGDIVSIYANNKTFLYSDDHNLVSISGFMTLPRTVGEYVVAFSAARTIPPPNAGPASVSFNEVPFNIGDDFNPMSGAFRCRIPGVYLFTVSAGANLTGGRSSCRLYKGNRAITRIVRRGAHGLTLSETMATVVLVSLEKDDVVELKCYGVYSDSRRHITFSGVSMHPRAAFSAARSYSQADNDFKSNLPGNSNDDGSPKAIFFDKTTINIGHHFDTSTSVFLCSVPGLYHVTFSTGKRRNDHVHILLMRNDEPIASIYQVRSYVEPGNNTLESTSSRSVIVDLSFGDEVYLQSVPGTAYYSSNDYEMTFSATLLNKCYYCPGVTANVGPTTITSTTTTTKATPEPWQWRK